MIILDITKPSSNNYLLLLLLLFRGGKEGQELLLQRTCTSARYVQGTLVHLYHLLYYILYVTFWQYTTPLNLLLWCVWFPPTPSCTVLTCAVIWFIVLRLLSTGLLWRDSMMTVWEGLLNHHKEGPWFKTNCQHLPVWLQNLFIVNNKCVVSHIESDYECFCCAFHKHANCKLQKLPSQLRFSLPSIIITITSKEPWNTETHKTDRNPPITNHKPWLTAAKNPIVSWLLNFRTRMFVKSAVINM